MMVRKSGNGRKKARRKGKGRTEEEIRRKEGSHMSQSPVAYSLYNSWTRNCVWPLHHFHSHHLTGP